VSLPRVLVITGTGTGVGKTVATAAVAAVARTAGRRVAIVKPAQTGVSPGEPGDVQQAGRLAGVADLHELARLTHPLAPRTAARLSGEPLPPLDSVIGVVAGLADRCDLVLVEGAGGVLVELDPDGATVTDLATRLSERVGDGPGLATLVVATPGLGTLNHTGLTVEALARRRVRVLGTVLGSWPARPGLAERCNVEDLPRLTGVPLLGRIPADAGRLDPGTFAARSTGWLAPALGGTWAAEDVRVENGPTSRGGRRSPGL
jgi:dethiobiotin synthetase